MMVRPNPVDHSSDIFQQRRKLFLDNGPDDLELSPK
jgi:hypothetical protein